MTEAEAGGSTDRIISMYSMIFFLEAEQKLHTLEQKMAELSEGSGSKKISNEENKHMNMKLKLYGATVVDYQAKML